MVKFKHSIPEKGHQDQKTCMIIYLYIKSTPSQQGAEKKMRTQTCSLSYFCTYAANWPTHQESSKVQGEEDIWAISVRREWNPGSAEKVGDFLMNLVYL